MTTKTQKKRILKVKVKKRKTCRVCGSKNLIDILSLGNHAVSNFVDKKEEAFIAPLDLVLCNPEEGGCSLLQLKHTAVEPELLYRNYWYKSGMNQTMRDALADITRQIEKLIKLEKNDIVLDIGANDGTLLKAYKSKKVKKVGVEPARNLIKELRETTDTVINDFFTYESFTKKLRKKAKAKVVTTIAMFYDLEEPNKFVADIKKVLAEGGIWINQMSYLPLMLEQNAFDNICHEHVEYYSLTSIENLLKRHNLEVFDVELNDVNGGSFRLYIRHKKDGLVKSFRGADKRFQKLKRKEERMGLGKKRVYQDFAHRVEGIKKKVTFFIKNEAKKDRVFHVYGASTKGNTLLQYFGLGNSLIEAASERNPNKWGKKTVMTLIPIISEKKSRIKKPEYYLVLPWHFRKEFLERERRYLRKGGKMVFPLPKFEVVGTKNGKLHSYYPRIKRN